MVRLSNCCSQTLSVQSQHELIFKEKRAKLSVSKCSKLGEAAYTCSRISNKTRFHKELTYVCRFVYVKYFHKHKCRGFFPHFRMTGCFVAVYESHSGKLKKKQRIAKSSHKTKLWKSSICAVRYSVPKALLRPTNGHLSAVLPF